MSTKFINPAEKTDLYCENKDRIQRNMKKLLLKYNMGALNTHAVNRQKYFLQEFSVCLWNAFPIHPAFVKSDSDVGHHRSLTM